MRQKYQDLQRQLASGTDMAGLETDVYSALFSFFNRYYDEGDFISKRRYKEGVYAIPYEGEEVKLYWANQDQYYIKTSENFKDYTFIAEGVTVHFRLVDATTEQNNNKESDDSKRTFMLYTENEEYPDIHTFDYDPEKRELIIRFVFDIPEDKKRKYKEENYAAIKQKIASDYEALWSILMTNTSNDPKKPRPLLLKHLDAYVAKNTFDYFIHKDLGGFLRRELDFYIKSEVMHLDDLDTDNEQRVNTYLAKVKAIKRVGHVIIDFLAQLEDFQKKLWLKKKFVVETNWCITLDHIDEDFWPEIIANKAQIQEWIDMYAIDEISESLTTVGFSSPLTMEFLRQNQNLILDTKHFSQVFKEKLIASIDDLDEQTGGLMIWSDNFHGVNLLSRKYADSVKCIYLDPPYNAQSSEILYKNTYKHSAWLSMMDNRLTLARKLQADDCVNVIAIDEVEQTRLGELLREVYPNKNIAALTLVHNPSGQQGDFFSFTNEFAYFVYPNIKGIIGLEDRPEEDWDTRTFRDNSGNNN
ncbi:MAG: site-specific DNA-methyltransferase, partial [Erysipelotrichaceae bacterium]|nr:site-specific DNA-methyltransferase [Erysipelotrichaceae bacterium]